MPNKTIPALPAAATLTGAEELECVQGGASKRLTSQAIANLGGLGYLVYTALLTQAGTDAPVATVLGDNTIGAIVWTREAPGVYLGTLAAAFPAGKTICPSGLTDINPGTGYLVKREDDNSCSILTGEIGGGSLGDDILNATPIEIRVYP